MLIRPGLKVEGRVGRLAMTAADRSDRPADQMLPVDGHGPVIVKVEAAQRSQSEALVVNRRQGQRVGITRRYFYQWCRRLAVRVDNDHLDREGGVISHIHGGTERDDFDVVFDSNLAHQLVCDLLDLWSQK